jgi:hypothetical protein
MRKQVFLTVIMALGISQAMAGDLAECSKLEDPDKKHHCLGSYAGSATYCDKIKNGELKRDCLFKVVRVQRDVTYKPPKPKPAPPPEE